MMRWKRRLVNSRRYKELSLYFSSFLSAATGRRYSLRLEHLYKTFPKCALRGHHWVGAESIRVPRVAFGVSPTRVFRGTPEKDARMRRGALPRRFGVPTFWKLRI